MNTKHTPGPLFVDNSNQYSVCIVDSKGECVSQEPRYAYSSKQETVEDVMTGRYMGKSMQEAIEGNARQLADMRLRAAAPDLLESANLLSAVLAPIAAATRDENLTAKIAIARAAIAKATGEQQ